MLLVDTTGSKTDRLGHISIISEHEAIVTKARFSQGKGGFTVKSERVHLVDRLRGQVTRDVLDVGQVADWHTGMLCTLLLLKERQMRRGTPTSPPALRLCRLEPASEDVIGRSDPLFRFVLRSQLLPRLNITKTPKASEPAFRLADGPSVVCLIDATSVLWWCNSEWVEHRLHPSPGPACLFSGRNQTSSFFIRCGPFMMEEVGRGAATCTASKSANYAWRRLTLPASTDQQNLQSEPCTFAPPEVLASCVCLNESLLPAVAREQPYVYLGMSDGSLAVWGNGRQLCDVRGQPGSPTVLCPLLPLGPGELVAVACHDVQLNTVQLYHFDQTRESLTLLKAFQDVHSMYRGDFLGVGGDQLALVPSMSSGLSCASTSNEQPHASEELADVWVTDGVKLWGKKDCHYIEEAPDSLDASSAGPPTESRKRRRDGSPTQDSASAQASKNEAEESERRDAVLKQFCGALNKRLEREQAKQEQVRQELDVRQCLLHESQRVLSALAYKDTLSTQPRVVASVGEASPTASRFDQTLLPLEGGSDVAEGGPATSQAALCLPITSSTLSKHLDATSRTLHLHAQLSIRDRLTLRQLSIGALSLRGQLDCASTCLSTATGTATIDSTLQLTPEMFDPRSWKLDVCVSCAWAGLEIMPQESGGTSGSVSDSRHHPAGSQTVDVIYLSFDDMTTSYSPQGAPSTVPDPYELPQRKALLACSQSFDVRQLPGIIAPFKCSNGSMGYGRGSPSSIELRVYACDWVSLCLVVTSLSNRLPTGVVLRRDPHAPCVLEGLDEVSRSLHQLTVSGRSGGAEAVLMSDELDESLTVLKLWKDALQ